MPKAHQKALKAAGCPGFRSSRIYSGEVIKWDWERRAASSGEDGVDWGKELKKEQAKAAKEKRLRAAREIVNFAEAQQAIDAGAAVIFSGLDRVFCNELPPALKGLDEVAIRDRCRAEIRQIRLDAIAALKMPATEPEPGEANGQG